MNNTNMSLFLRIFFQRKFNYVQSKQLLFIPILNSELYGIVSFNN